MAKSYCSLYKIMAKVSCFPKTTRIYNDTNFSWRGREFEEVDIKDSPYDLPPWISISDSKAYLSENIHEKDIHDQHHAVTSWALRLNHQVFKTIPSPVSFPNVSKRNILSWCVQPDTEKFPYTAKNTWWLIDFYFTFDSISSTFVSWE